MHFFHDHIISLLIFFPLLWMLLGRWLTTSFQTLRYYTIGATLESMMAWYAVGSFPKLEPLAWVEHQPWIPSLGVAYHVGASGLSVWLMALTSMSLWAIMMCAVLWPNSFGIPKEEPKAIQYWHNVMGCFFMITAFCIGVFASQDIILFYFFWELLLLPLVFLMMQLSNEKRIQAGLEFFLATFAGSLIMLFGLFFVLQHHAQQTGVWSSALQDLKTTSHLMESGYTGWQSICFWCFMIGFGVKVPLFPLFFWLKNTYSSATYPWILASSSVLLKLGAFGIATLAIPLFQTAATLWSPVMMLMSAIGILLAACFLWSEKNFKVVLGYLSVSHMGIVCLGLFSSHPLGIKGAYFQMLAHGFTAIGMFAWLMILAHYTQDAEQVLSLEYLQASLGGLAKKTPRFAVMAGVFFLSAVGLPGTAGFIGEWLCLLGSFYSAPWVTAITLCAMMLSAAALLNIFRGVFFGKAITHPARVAIDLNFIEMLFLGIFGTIISCLGVMPQLMLQYF